MSKESNIFKSLRSQIRSSKVEKNNNTITHEDDDDYMDARSDMLDMLDMHDNVTENKDGYNMADDDFDVGSELKTIESISKSNSIHELKTTISDQNNRQIKKAPILDYIFTPKSDITTYELARLLSFIQMSVDQNVFDNLPIELKKHFTKCID